MDKETLTALKGSIEKWDAVARGDGYEWACKNCPLCKEHPECDGCPVAENGFDGCNGSPYFEWDDHQETAHGKFTFKNKRKVVPGCAECARLALKEAAFLRSLLPKLPAKKPARK
jgi:hypothetical protein